MSTYETRKPAKVPEAGYYYHYKHDPKKGFNDYAYLIFGVGHHTEDDCRPQDAHMQVYLPLYEDAFVYKNGMMFDLRPLDMAMEEVEFEGKMVPRFKKIDDLEIISKLEEKRKKMYKWPLA